MSNTEQSTPLQKTAQSSKQKAALSTLEAAEYLGMSKSALEKARLTGELFGATPPVFCRYGKAVRYTKTSLDNWLAALPTFKTLAEQEAA